MPRRRRPAEPLPDVIDFMQLLWALVHGLESRSKRMATSIGITGPQRLVVRMIGLRPGISAGALAAMLHVHPSTLTGILARLVGQGIVARLADAADRRRAVLDLTAKGRRLNRLKRGTVESAIARVLARARGRDLLAARRVLARLARDLRGEAV
jgi:MarR family transcriptional regulator, organic hydroperoxide resistance regulator